MSWFTQQWAVYTPTSGPVSITGDTPAAIRHSGPDGSGIDIALTGDSPAAQRNSGPDGALVITTVLTDTPAGIRSSGPDGVIAIGVTLTDGPLAIRAFGPDGSAGEGVSLGPDTPMAIRAYGPDGLVQPDLVVTDMPSGCRAEGPDGALALGITLTDAPSACRYLGPAGSVFADVGGGVSITDAPGATRFSGPDGLLAIGIVLVGDSPLGTRFGGPDGLLAIGIVLVDTPMGSRYGGPDGLAIAILSDTPCGTRFGGPDGGMGIGTPLTGDSPTGIRVWGPDGLISIGVGADIIAGTAAPTGVRYGGPDGEVWPAFLPSRPPYIPAAPLVAPSYSLWLADTVTGKLLYQLPVFTLTWSSKLNDIGTIRASIAIEKAWDSLSDQDERDPRILLREIISGPWRYCLVLRWGNNTVWAGPYISMSRPAPDHIELNGAEIGKMFTKRLLIAPGATYATDVAADTTFANATKPHIAAALVLQSMSQAGYGLPITVVDPGGSGIDNRTYFGYDLANYWEKIAALMAELDGPEIRFDPQVTTGVDGEYVSWVMQIGGPHIGRGLASWVFDSDINSIVGMDVDGSNMALGVWMVGSGQSRDRLIAPSKDTTLLSIGWPMLEETDNSNSSETSYPLLAARASASLAAHKQPATAFKASVPADLDPMVGTYHVGEDFVIEVHNDPIIPDGLYTRRIAALDGSEKPWVTITDTDPLPVGSS